VNLTPDDAMELGQLLRFLDNSLTTDRGAVNEGLTRFVGCDAYSVQSLRDDLAHSMFLLGESDGERSLLPALSRLSEPGRDGAGAPEAV
jgi:hypothetical protein